MKSIYKYVFTILLAISLCSAGLLWLTKVRFLPSMSAFAKEPNVIYYILMHSFAAMSMFTYGMIIAFMRRQFSLATLVGVGLLGILTFNMYDYPTIHNSFTAATILLAFFHLILYSRARERYINIGLAIVGVLLFCLGYWTNLHLFFAEAVVLICVGIGYSRRVWYH